MVCHNCENCYKIELNSGGFGVYRRTSSRLESVWYDSHGNVVSDAVLISELESKANDSTSFDCKYLSSSNGSNDIYPTYTDPYAKLEYGCEAVYEVGTAVDLMACLSTTFNKGEIILQGSKQNDRAGDIIDSSIFVNSNENNTIIPTVIPLGETNFTYKVDYDEGPQPKDALGMDYDSPLPAGTVYSNVVKVFGVAPFFATTNEINTLDKLPLVYPDDKYVQFILVSENPGKQKFLIPEDREIEGIYVFNPLTQSYELTIEELYNITGEIKNINGVDVRYTRYSHNGYYRSEIDMKIKLK